ncbi:hypothetical protein HYPSUDRAFT_207582 [Hypholoma sublateritium FD-334 SS-4]|uniref:Uncharacterized protein n=1 Tax=Hypholoma sublateritium (strain FD-334 SS-4) TaxID=945553 RepID=A0A0D2LY45_HYPSF|nr:hypothetical protein HYPSUDRAFT_207582 [Hypholoma sublateritium FD-334 SS-4]
MVPVRASELAQTPIFGTPRRFTSKKRRHGACAGTAARTGAACNRQDLRAPTTRPGRLREHRSSRGLRSSFPHPFWIQGRRDGACAVIAASVGAVPRPSASFASEFATTAPAGASTLLFPPFSSTTPLHNMTPPL